MLAWYRRQRAERTARNALVETDALDLIARFGATAYFVARDRDRTERAGRVVDGDRRSRHWAAVKGRVAALTGHLTGADTAMRYSEGRGPSELPEIGG